MTSPSTENLPDEAQLAIAYTAAAMRRPLTVFLELDARLARIVAATNEPMLGQMRLAWWRDMLAKPFEERPQGDAVLDGIGDHWAGHEAALSALVDAWEIMLAENLDAAAALEFATNRARPAEALAEMVSSNAEQSHAVGRGMIRWALADAAVNISSSEEREILLQQATAQLRDRASYPRSLKGLRILSALAERSVRKGGRPLMEGRGAALTAIRAAMLG
ncbi:hypothetical protein NAP1_05630 [Erythrobacter sp. NAP1]|uniref:hypothetical protein n=1 Tax=Erythrobacter sp. NAP1 TaxID=237727 RepID=UPI0000686BFB|nr:hypothetical protein [Erythrobacter sp. NAP1]EAQ30232.1 hypothetical protein NAP1_05630 [Erythrobacter sp. NAP1]